MIRKIDFSDTFFVAGSNGMAGSAICRALNRNGYRNILKPLRKELNLSRPKKGYEGIV